MKECDFLVFKICSFKFNLYRYTTGVTPTRLWTWLTSC
jgi:hypothetical protein